MREGFALLRDLYADNLGLASGARRRHPPLYPASVTSPWNLTETGRGIRAGRPYGGTPALVSKGNATTRERQSRKRGVGADLISSMVQRMLICRYEQTTDVSQMRWDLIAPRATGVCAKTRMHPQVPLGKCR
jgi:hypothetical protein